MKRERFAELTIFLAIMLSLSVAPRSAAANAQARSDDQPFAGAWNGTYTSDANAVESLSYVLSRDEQGRWRGTLKYTNQDGEHTGEFKLIEIVEAKFKGKVDMHAGAFEVTLAGELKGDQLAGTYSLAARDSSEIIEKGTWKLTRRTAAKTEH